MKKYLSGIAYRLVSSLSDVSGGRPIFVRWKVALAAIVIGLSTTSLSSCRPFATCYKPAEPYEETLCYAIVDEFEEGEDSNGAEIEGVQTE